MLSHLAAHWRYLWLLTASCLAGIMNALAAGGSFLSFPAMLGVGVAPIQANATNTVALWPGQLTSVAALRSDLRRDLVPSILLASVLGGLSGSWVLLHTRQRTFLHLVPWLLLSATLLFGISGPVSRWIHHRSGTRTATPDPVTTEATAATTPAPEQPPSTSTKTPPRLPLFLALLVTCFYIGYFGAGAGFLLMTTLALFGIDSMRELNSHKVLAACTSNLCAVLTFIVSGAVLWHYCLVSLLFAAAGGWLGARYARRINPTALRTIVVCTGLLVSAWFFYRQHTGNL